MKFLIIIIALLFSAVELTMPDPKLLEAMQTAQQMDEQQGEASEFDEQERVNRFLQAIGQIESSGGQNFNHEELQSGIHKGHRAAGTYGLMPNTINEVLNRMRLSGNENPDFSSLSSMTPDALKQHVESNPDVEREIATNLARTVLEKQGGDEEKAAYSWFQGHNLSPEEIEKRNYKEHDYVNKYRKYKGK